MAWDKPRDTRAKSKAVAYTEAELELLQKLWPIATMEELREAFPARSQCGLIQKAKGMGLEIEKTRMRKGDIAPLVDGSLVSFYWLGFILADGHITKAGQLTIKVNDPEERHLEAFAEYVGAKVKKPYSNLDKSYAINGFLSEESLRKLRRVAVQDPETCKKIMEILGLSNTNKTTNPPNKTSLDDMSDEQVTALFIGFFDGDGGTPVTRFGGRIENHISWKSYHEAIAKRGLCSEPFVGKKGTSSIYVPKEKMISMAKFITEHSLPVLRRKWKKWFGLINEMEAVKQIAPAMKM